MTPAFSFEARISPRHWAPVQMAFNAPSKAEAHSLAARTLAVAPDSLRPAKEAR